MKKMNKNQKGQSLIELLVGVLILALVLTAAVFLGTRSVQMADLTANREKAIFYAKNALEEVRKARENMLWTEFINQIENLEDEIEIEDFYTINLLTNEIEDEVLEVTAQISWTDVKGEHTINRNTYFGRF